MMNRKIFLILGAAIIAAIFGFNSKGYAAGEDPCSSLQEPSKRGRMSAALELKLMLLCGEITQDELDQRRSEVMDDATVLPPSVPGFIAGEATSEMANAPGPDILVNNPALDVGRTTQSETSIVAVGSTVCAAWNDGGAVAGLSGFGFSSNGGATWSDGGDFPNGPGPDTNWGDPSLAWSDRDGTFYYAALSTRGLSLWRSTDMCRTFGYVGPIHVGSGDDKELMAIDNNPASPYYGRIYVVWTDFSSAGGDRIWRTYSSNGGATWSAPLALSGVGVDVQGAWPAVAPNGDVYASWVRWNPYPSGNIDIEVVRSTNGGASFSFRTRPMTNRVNPRDSADTTACGRPALNGDIRYLPSPQIVVGPNSNVHIVYSYDPDGFNVGDVVNVYYRRSTNGAASWGPEIRLNNDATTRDQWFPAIAVNQNNDLVASWYDRRLNANNWNFDRYARISNDSGITWGPNIRVSDVSSPVSTNLPHFDGLARCYHGDYDQLAMDANRAHVLWSDDRRVTGSGPNPDIYYDYISLLQPTGVTMNFDPPCAFAQTLPMQIYMALETNAIFVSGNGSVLHECSNFGVTGHSSPYFLAWNGDLSNRDGSIPALPAGIIFTPNVSSVSMNVGAGLGVTGTVVLTAYDSNFNLLDTQTVPISSALQNLTVRASGNIFLVILSTQGATRPILVADDLRWQ
jgi:hypothetical protein